MRHADDMLFFSLMMFPYHWLACFFGFDPDNVRMALRAEGKAAEAETLYTEAVEADGMSLYDSNVVGSTRSGSSKGSVGGHCMSLSPEFLAVASLALTRSGSSKRGGGSGFLSFCASCVCNTCSTM